jgi:hypothetical protein
MRKDHKIVLIKEVNISTFLRLTYCSGTSMQSSCPILMLLFPNYSSPSIHVLLAIDPFSLVIKVSIHVCRLMKARWKFGYFQLAV